MYAVGLSRGIITSVYGYVGSICKSADHTKCPSENFTADEQMSAYDECTEFIGLNVTSVYEQDDWD